jgi:hypothetical protein
MESNLTHRKTVDYNKDEVEDMDINRKEWITQLKRIIKGQQKLNIEHCPIFDNQRILGEELAQKYKNDHVLTFMNTNKN